MAEKKKQLNLAQLFITSALGLMTYASYKQYAPDSWQDDVNSHFRLPAWLHINKHNDLQPIFQTSSSLKVLGEEGKGVQVSADDDVTDRWYGVLGRHELLLNNDVNKTLLKSWFSQLDHLKGKSLEAKAKGVNDFVGQQIKYVSDIKNYGRSEYWATPLETISCKKGDCEDFAILNYYALRYLGVPKDRMYMLVVDTKNQGYLNHAVLAVNVREPSYVAAAYENVVDLLMKREASTNFLLLDNDGGNEASAEKDSDYKFHYAMNEDGLWTVPKNSRLNPRTPVPAR